METTKKKALYLDGAVSVQKEGPSLTVLAEGKASAYYPFARLARVVARPEVQWEMDAFLATLDAGIPIVLLDKQGFTRAICHPRQNQALPLFDHFAALFDDPSFPERYENWKASWHRRVICYALKQLGWFFHDLRPKAVEKRLTQILKQQLGPSFSTIQGRLFALLDAQVAAFLNRAGFSSEIIAGINAPIALAKDLAMIERWIVRYMLLQKAPANSQRKTLIFYYEENLSPKVEDGLNRLLYALNRLS